MSRPGNRFARTTRLVSTQWFARHYIHRRYYLTTRGVAEAAGFLGFATPSDFVRAYPVSREWLALLIRRMDAVAAVYRIAASLSPGTGSLRSHVEFHRRGRFDATTTLHDGRTFGVVRPGPGPAAPVALRPPESHSGIRLHPLPRHHSDPDAQHLGGEADDEVLRGRGTSVTATSPWSPGTRWKDGTFASGVTPHGC